MAREGVPVRAPTVSREGTTRAQAGKGVAHAVHVGESRRRGHLPAITAQLVLTKAAVPHVKAASVGDTILTPGSGIADIVRTESTRMATALRVAKIARMGSSPIGAGAAVTTVQEAGTEVACPVGIGGVLGAPPESTKPGSESQVAQAVLKRSICLGLAERGVLTALMGDTTAELAKLGATTAQPARWRGGAGSHAATAQKASIRTQDGGHATTASLVNTATLLPRLTVANGVHWASGRAGDTTIAGTHHTATMLSIGGSNTTAEGREVAGVRLTIHGDSTGTCGTD